jgi:hypothetical protein
MSRNAKIHPSNSVSTKKPYCKVCFDAGKPESMYTSHWVRTLPDRNGKTTVLCPTLLETECRFCYKLGHTTKFCPAIEQNKKQKEGADRKLKVSEEKPKISKSDEKKKPVSIYDALRVDSDSEDESQDTNIVENFPMLATTLPSVQVKLPSIQAKLPTVQPEVKTGWAAIAAKPKEDPFMKHPSGEVRSTIKSLPQSIVKPSTRDYTTPLYTKSWADWSDSESDDDMPLENPVLKYQSKLSGWSTNFSMDDADEDW